MLARAFALFASARPRPVHIEIPIDVIAMEADPSIVAVKALPKRPAPQAADIAQAASWLQAAKAPLVILGGGAVDAAPAIRALVAHLDAPVINTVNAKGILPQGHALRIGENMAFPTVHAAIAAADAVLAIGTEFGETEMYPEPKPLTFGGKLIRIDIDPEQLVRGVAADLPILADAGLAVLALNAALGVDAKNTQVKSDSAGARRAANVRAATPKHWWPAIALHQRIAKIVLAALPDAIIAGDSTEPVYALNQCYESPTPRAYFNSSTGYGTLGYGLPAGIGAKLAAPGRPVVVLIGDGGLQFTIAELASAVEAEIPLIVLLWNNDGYGEIKTYMVDRQIHPIGVDIYTPDFLTIAKGFGCGAVRPDSVDALTQSLKTAATGKRPTIIEIRADAPYVEALR